MCTDPSNEYLQVLFYIVLPLCVMQSPAVFNHFESTVYTNDIRNDTKQRVIILYKIVEHRSIMVCHKLSI